MRRFVITDVSSSYLGVGGFFFFFFTDLHTRVCAGTSFPIPPNGPVLYITRGISSRVEPIWLEDHFKMNQMWKFLQTSRSVVSKICLTDSSQTIFL